MRIYLAGFINNEVMDQCIAWRKNLRNHYHNYKGQVYPITWLDPCNGEADANVNLKDEGLKSNIPAKLIMYRDYISVVKMADLIIANMDTFGRQRYPVGTIMEVAWAWEHHKPVIVVDPASDEDSVWAKHPMFSTATAFRVKSVDELIQNKTINFLFKGWNSAIY